MAAPGESRQHIAVDARLLGSGGIGTYLEELLPRVIEALPSVRFTLLGDEAVLRDLVSPSPRVAIRRFAPRIYSIREQVQFPAEIPRSATLFWSPHYNIPLAWRGPLAVTVHDVAHLSLRQSSLARRAYARWMFAAVRRRAAVVFAVSDWTASEIELRVGRPRRLVVTRNGVSSHWLEPRSMTTASLAPYFLFVGSVKPHKNLSRLIEAFASVADEVPHRLVIAGRADGMRTVDFAAIERATALGDRAAYVGQVPPAELERLIRQCDALVLPSIHEGFGLPPLEALAAGRPVAVSALPVFREVCGPMAEYFDPLDVSGIADALKRLARRVPDTEDIIERRRNWARRFNWDSAALATRDALLRAMAD